ncbi:hypothetical protein [Burkholderia cepacia]|uniref:hypothetical protein n=1 Tax=Burkholderia cepacia TaxID=292 RepID=UPI001C935523|nr:hypothetical protein [Burkholderia cepacia]MBY4714190.1 hypothetical protein [Burkholderia cepacia]MBY4739576.1 hypothetical protein [Burkholderia cepacia]MBY4747467.1 hypothetical protein [Burkholderia cepacia]MBY4761197.1 hypothetical protein [Burkholderia cepacia]MBY4778193.1 hypothetical protein [Burkholderia cepacia]
MANGTGSRHDGAAMRDVRTHESLVAAPERARSRSGSTRERVARDRSLPHVASHYVVKRSDAAETDSRVHKKGAGRTQTFPELWNGASGSLAGGFRIACRPCGLEETLEFGRGCAPVGGRQTRTGLHDAAREIPP